MKSMQARRAQLHYFGIWGKVDQYLMQQSFTYIKKKFKFPIQKSIILKHVNIIGMTRTQTKRAGYKKNDKIMDITAHFYTNKRKIYVNVASETLNFSV